MIVIDYKDRKPIYEQIIERFQALILQGILTEGTQLPSVRTLAMELSINPNTIQRAYAELENQNLIYPVKGRGNFVSKIENIRQEKKKLYWKELEETIVQAKVIGISEQELIQNVEQMYKEEKV